MGVIDFALDVWFGAKTLKIRICSHPTCVVMQIRSQSVYPGVSAASVACHACMAPLSATVGGKALGVAHVMSFLQKHPHFF